jgi:hypothetical protein
MADSPMWQAQIPPTEAKVAAHLFVADDQSAPGSSAGATKNDAAQQRKNCQLAKRIKKPVPAVCSKY